MPLYQLTMFYSTLEEHSDTIRLLRNEVQSISGENWRVLSAGQDLSAIVFETDTAHSELQERFVRYGDERFMYLLTQISVIVGGCLETGVWQWLDRRLPAGN
jgi:hypothetical protein